MSEQSPKRMLRAKRVALRVWAILMAAILIYGTVGALIPQPANPGWVNIVIVAVAVPVYCATTWMMSSLTIQNMEANHG